MCVRLTVAHLTMWFVLHRCGSLRDHSITDRCDIVCALVRLRCAVGSVRGARAHSPAVGLLACGGYVAAGWCAARCEIQRA